MKKEYLTWLFFLFKKTKKKKKIITGKHARVFLDLKKISSLCEEVYYQFSVDLDRLVFLQFGARLQFLPGTPRKTVPISKRLFFLFYQNNWITVSWLNEGYARKNKPSKVNCKNNNDKNKINIATDFPKRAK